MKKKANNKAQRKKIIQAVDVHIEEDDGTNPLMNWGFDGAVSARPTGRNDVVNSLMLL